MNSSETNNANNEQLVVDAKSENTTSNVLNHSNRKIVVYNIDKFLKPKPLSNLLSKWIDACKEKKDIVIKISKSKKPPNNNWVVITLDDENMVEPFMDTINDGNYKNKKGVAIIAQRPSDGSGEEDGEGNGKKRTNVNPEDNSRAAKRLRRDPVECVKTEDEVRDKLTPYWKMTYEEQLDAKTKMMVNKCFQRIIGEIKKKFQVLHREMKKGNGGNKDIDPLYKWVKRKNAINMSPILGAPKRVKYRNKCELTFGFRHSYEFDENGMPKLDDSAKTESVDEGSREGGDAVTPNYKIIKTPAVGFMAGGWAGGVSDPHCLANIPDVVCSVADVINMFLKTSPIPPYDALNHRGVWRSVTIRSSERTKQCMVIIMHAPPSGGAGKREDGSDDYSEHFEGEKQRLIQMLTESNLPRPTRSYPGHEEHDSQQGDEMSKWSDSRVTSLFFQEFEGLSNPPPQHPVQHLYGQKFIEEKLLQCEFQISPGAFFQVTTEGAEQLYSVVVEKVKEVTENPKDTLLFDVCCGTGTIGITCMKEGAVGKVIGIDVSEPAIKDAIENAERNGYSRSDDHDVTRFVASRAELVMQSESQNVDRNTPMVAVVDPARDGLHQDVIKSLRNQSSLQRIVYVSCNPTGSLIKDATLLCTPCTKKYRGLPFKITSAQPVDMFPLTDHCEMVMVFDRMSQEECDGTEDDVQNNTDSVNTE
jgi:tRNA (uracil-5-)-methyltransferase